MKKMTLLEQALLDLMRQKQICEAIQYTQQSSMVKLTAQIEDLLKASHLTDVPKLQMLQQSHDR